EMEWTSKLPHVFARTGFQDNFYFVAQWFPKPGVYEAAGERHREAGGWNCHQFHANTEFYADFGTFDVDLTVPSDYAIAATGTQRSQTPSRDGTTTYNYYQEDVHDFAWTAQPAADVLVLERVFQGSQRVTEEEVRTWAARTQTPADRVRLDDVKVTLFLQREHRDQAERHWRAAFEAIKWFGLMYGKYPYETLTVVDPPFGALGAGGMEYPTLITAGTEFWPGLLDQNKGPEGVIVHEFGHQYWYGLVANNEFEEAWLDEGFNTYSTGKVMDHAFGANYTYEPILGVPIPALPWLKIPVPRYPWKGVKEFAVGPYWEWIPVDQLEARRRRYAEHASSDAMDTRSWETLNRESYRVQAYDKPALTLKTLERVIGADWARLIRAYQQRFRFRHPDATDFVETVQQAPGRDLGW
ncbi:MAG: M1 family metallopeptidase, partial [Terriglobales bacterium]